MGFVMSAGKALTGIYKSLTFTNVWFTFARYLDMALKYLFDGNGKEITVTFCFMGLQIEILASRVYTYSTAP